MSVWSTKAHVYLCKFRQRETWVDIDHIRHTTLNTCIMYPSVTDDTHITLSCQGVSAVGLKRYAQPTIRYNMRYDAHDMICFAIWWQRSGSTLVQVIACCQWHCHNKDIIMRPVGMELKAVSQKQCQISLTAKCSKITQLKILLHLSGANEFTNSHFIPSLKHYLASGLLIQCVGFDQQLVFTTRSQSKLQ